MASPGLFPPIGGGAPGRRWPGPLLAAVVAMAVGCGSDAEPPSGAIRVVGEFGSSGEVHLWAPVDVEVDGDRVWVLDAGAGQAHAYDRGGRHVRTVGRAGRGPGELRDPLALGVAGDTLWVLNTGNARVEYFSREGRPIGSEPLPDSLPVPVDLVRWQGAFVGALPFGELPLARFGGREGPLLFGADLARRARELAPEGGAVPAVYRLGVIRGELWVTHLYLPLVGVYEAPDRPGRILEFDAPAAGRSETSYEEEAGRRRWLVKAPPRPAGGLGLLDLGDRSYLLTHRRDAEGRQVLVWWPDPDVPGRSVSGPPGLLLVAAAGAGPRAYAVGVRGEVEEPVAVIVEPGGGPETHVSR